MVATFVWTHELIFVWTSVHHVTHYMHARDVVCHSL